jgi:sterol desaturase/sphingolipid hydroxylase (fatty acid hydroxylase superfamily)
MENTWKKYALFYLPNLVNSFIKFIIIIFFFQKLRIVYRTLETMDGHCGYEFPWSPFRVMPFSGSSEYHNFHHSYNEGNYSSLFTYWDTIFKTNEHFYKLRPKELCSKLEKNSENKNPSI